MNKLPTTPSQLEIINKVDEIIDSNFIPNTATNSASLTIQGTATSQTSSINIGALSSATDNFCTVVGGYASATKDSTVAVGYNAKANDTSATALGQGAEASGLISTAIGASAKATGILAIQIGSGTNSTNRSMAVGFGTDKEYQLLDGTTGLIPDARISSNIARTSDLSTVATSGSYNDLSDKPTIPTVNNATLTITQGGTTKGTFTANAGTDVTIDLDAGGGSSTDVQINGTSITSGGVADIVTEGVYDATDNKIATMSDLATKQDVLTAGTNISIVSAPPMPTVDTRSTATVSTVGSSNWQEVAYINGKFIAVGNSGYIMTSTDGETWGTPYKKGSYTWRGIAYGNNTYVICGNNGSVAYSTDGENWTTTTAGTIQLNDVIFVNNTFIAVSTGKYLATSTDGANWTVSQSTVFSNKPFDISYYNGVYIVSEESGKVETSTDLSTWTTVSVGSGTWNAIAYAYGKYVIAGAGGYMSYSTDLSTWATPFRVGTEDWQELVLGDGYLVAVGNSGNTSTTTDGETWTTVVTIGSDNWYGLACNGSNYVAVGVSGVTTNFEITNGQEGGTVINGAEIVSAVDSTSTNSQCVGAKLFYDTVGDIETALNTINSGVSA